MFVNFLFLAFIFFLTSGFSYPSDNQRIVDVGSKILNSEQKLVVLLKKLDQLIGAKTALKVKLDESQFELANVIVNLRSFKKIMSVPLVMSFKKTDDFVHTMLLLRYLSPQITCKHKAAFVFLDHLSDNASEIERHKGLLSELDEEIRQLKSQKERLIEEKHRLSAPLFYPVKLRQDRDLRHMNLDRLSDKIIAMWNEFSPLYGSKEAIAVRAKISLLLPVYGELERGCIGYICPRDEKPKFQINLKSYADFQVTSPTLGIVAFVGFLNKKGYVVVLKRHDLYIFVTGLGSTHCRIGEHVVAGEPIGYMPNIETNKRPILKIQIRKGGALLDPFFYFKHFLKNSPQNS